MVKNLKLLMFASDLLFMLRARINQNNAPAPKADTVVPLHQTTFSGSLEFVLPLQLREFTKFPLTTYTSFTNSQNSLELGMATIRADHSWAKGGVTVELGFGRRADEFSYNDGASNGFFSLKNVVRPCLLQYK